MIKSGKKRKSKEAQEETRFRVVEYLKKKLGNQKEAAEIFNITAQAVSNIWVKYKREGKSSLRSRKRGTQGGGKLNKEMIREIKIVIKEKLPDQLKMPFGLWTREAVQLLIEQQYGISLGKSQIGRLLKRWGYTPQKPISKAFEQKPERVKSWLKNEYPAIERRAKEEGATIYFGDETGMRSDHQTGKSYAPKGQTPIIKRTGQRFSLNMISAISNRGHLQFMVLDGRFNGEVFQNFLSQMIKHSKKKIFFVTDGHPAHKTKKLNEWLAKNHKKIEVFFLPPYSPELNPQEYVNQDLKTNIIGKKRPINKQQMRFNVENFMNIRKSDKRQVKKYFHNKHVRYAA
jgi:transposase